MLAHTFKSEESHEAPMQPITPMLWYDTQALDAAQFYCSVFKRSKINTVNRYGEGGPMPKGTVLTVDFTILGQRFTALNGGPMFKFTEAISFVIDCKDQKEIDYYYAKLSAVPVAEQCGWIKDKFGVSWQLVPAELPKLLGDPARSQRAFAAMMQMKRIDLAALRAAAGPAKKAPVKKAAKKKK